MDYAFGQAPTNPLSRLGEINWLMVLLVLAIGGVGVAMLYSVADGSFQPWALRHATRLAVAMAIMVVVSTVNLGTWFRSAYVIYGACLCLLLAVEFIGVSGGGGQRWIDLRVMRIQPSEFMKLAVVLALARYFHTLSTESKPGLGSLLVPILLMAGDHALVDPGRYCALLAGRGQTLGVSCWADGDHRSHPDRLAVSA